jgi:hypothetical protein
MSGIRIVTLVMLVVSSILANGIVYAADKTALVGGRLIVGGQ